MHNSYVSVCTYSHIFYCSYSIMRECWNDDKEARSAFQEMKEEFDGLISLAERYKYVMPLGSVAAEAGLV